MYHVPMQVWNEIAKGQALSQPWATLFRMTPDQLPRGLEKLVDEPIEALGADNRTVLAYRLVAPLLIENEAISAFVLEDNRPDLRTAMPELISVNEAVSLASLEYRLTPLQQKNLTQLLQAAIQTTEDAARKAQQIN